ncbi:ABC1 domain containing protein [Moelleriella libera RCEF 2490]|uniref:Protein YAE1 n=1 Tax=Moelleriella libera RCEF 2490 TaxID=1081109 RepID=A0A168A144_9HYPO|nr:ABC1 domain containing protein [Moelleriella libera RCEF 2490]
MHFQSIEGLPDDACISQVGGGITTDLSQSIRQLDDVFASGPESSSDVDVQNGSHLSEVPRLETEHTNAGYREGITAAKETSIQAGFDEGYSLGATLGSRAGQLLGLIEGIAEALSDQSGEARDAAAQLQTEARKDLSAKSIFSAEFWASDGNWNYQVNAADGSQILFHDVANAHPLILKWSRLADEQARLWHVQTSILEEESGPRLNDAPAEPLNISTPASAKQALDW